MQQAVAHAVIAHDDLLRMKQSHKPLDQACSRKNNVGPLGFQAGDCLALRNRFAFKKRYLPLHLAVGW